MARKDQLKTEIQDINVQLQDPMKLVGGVQVSEEEYTRWRRSARTALRRMREEMNLLRAWIRSHQEAQRKSAERDQSWRQVSTLASVTPSRFNLGNPAAMAKNLSKIVGSLYALYLAAGEYVDASTDENYAELVRCLEHSEHLIGTEE
jgi:hypothetical protein